MSLGIHVNERQFIILQKAIHKQGTARQWDALMEEMAELIQAIIKIKHNPNDPDRVYNLKEELADVYMCLFNCINIVGIEDCQDAFDEKMEVFNNKLDRI